MRRYLQNPNYDEVIGSLIKLGDISKNQHVGEVRSALSKAQALINKYGFSHHQSRLNDALSRLEHYEKTGEAKGSASSSSSSSGSSSSGGGFNQSEYEELFRRWKARMWRW